jgi:hypothetical protein
MVDTQKKLVNPSDVLVWYEGKPLQGMTSQMEMVKEGKHRRSPKLKIDLLFWAPSPTG